MSGVHDVISEYIDILESAVSDPNEARRTKGLKWVYDDIPAVTMGADKYPRISVLSFTNPVEPHELGSYRQRQTVRIEIQIRVARTKWNTLTPTQFLDDLSLSVIEALRSTTAISQLLTNVHVFRAFLESENIVVGDDILIKQLVYKNLMVR
jgi:hypothetical protein